MSERQDLLVEIGTEELPTGSVVPLAEALAEGLRAALADAGLECAGSRAFGTPRRIGALLEGVPVRQPDRTVEKRGPSVDAAFASDGAPTRAALGFARSCGVDVDALEERATAKGRWLYYAGTETGAATAELLPDRLHSVVGALPVPRRMRWGSGGNAFVRPVHWLVVLHGETVVPTTIHGASAGRTTFGHRFHAPEPIVLDAPAEYAERLEREGRVIADPAERRRRVLAGSEAAAAAVGGTLVADAALVDEVAALVEWPVPLTGSFDERFLEVPPEALISSMQGHQKVFPVSGADGRLLPRFITVANLESRDPDEVIRGNERVIRPRLADAEFFWAQDRRQALADRIEALRGILFQDRLGTLHDKQARVAALARRVASAAGADPDQAERGAWLGKCDLLTEMVGEFPELQGTMGRYYALADGEPRAVSEALEAQYQPRFAGDQTPEGALGQALAVADRVDTLLGIFAIGQPPTGDKDPFALRRAGLGLLRVLIERRVHLSLRELLEAAAARLPAELAAGDQVDAVLGFLHERLRQYYHDQGVRPEILEAVAALEPDDPVDADDRLHAVRDFLEGPSAASLAAADKRVRNLLRRAEEALPEALDSALFETPEEAELAGAVEPVARQVDARVAERDYRGALEALATIRPAVDAYFEGVRVMAEDPAVRGNRLAQLRDLARLFSQVADLSRLPG